jgi:hypothetical protein
MQYFPFPPKSRVFISGIFAFMFKVYVLHNLHNSVWEFTRFKGFAPSLVMVFEIRWFSPWLEENQLVGKGHCCCMA